mmetsp:Transcript_72757/g.157908  ORF Transcript_72757/g.157908 Transcript_72757/m.157908 type:complete len:352 (+) Transcript_72757:778-1833(+)
MGATFLLPLGHRAELFEVIVASRLCGRIEIEMIKSLPLLAGDLLSALRVHYRMPIVDEACQHNAIAFEVSGLRHSKLRPTEYFSVLHADSHLRVQEEAPVLLHQMFVDGLDASTVHLLIVPVLLEALPDAALSPLRVRAELLYGAPTSPHRHLVHTDVLCLDLLLVKLGLRASRGELEPMRAKAIVNSSTTWFDIRAVIMDILYATAEDLRRGEDVFGALRDVAADLSPAVACRNVLHGILQALEHLAAPQILEIMAELIDVILAGVRETVLQAPIVVACLHVRLDGCPAKNGETVLHHVVLQATDHLSLALGNVEAVFANCWAAVVLHPWLIIHVVRLQGTLDHLRGHAL